MVELWLSHEPWRPWNIKVSRLDQTSLQRLIPKLLRRAPQGPDNRRKEDSAKTTNLEENLKERRDDIRASMDEKFSCLGVGQEVYSYIDRDDKSASGSYRDQGSDDIWPSVFRIFWIASSLCLFTRSRARTLRRVQGLCSQTRAGWRKQRLKTKCRAKLTQWHVNMGRQWSCFAQIGSHCSRNWKADLGHIFTTACCQPSCVAQASKRSFPRRVFQDRNIGPRCQ